MAAVCWVILITHRDSLALVPMAAVMMGAMMLPSAVPLVTDQAERPAGMVLVAAIYLAVWTVAGVALLLLGSVLPMATLPMALLAVAVAATYSLTPLQRGCRDRCLALCRGSKAPTRLALAYGLNCVGCSGGVMAALFVIGPMNPLWMLLATGVVALCKMPVRRVAIP